jgi:hypothetical protein
MSKWLIFAIISLILIAMQVFLHETTHQQIYREDNLDSVIEMTPGSYGLGWQTRITTDNGIVSDTAKLANMQNEIVGYNIMPFLVLFLSLAITEVVADD